MRVFGVVLAGVLALTTLIAAHSASLGSNIGQARTGPAPGVVRVGDAHSPNWHPAPGGGAVAGTRCPVMCANGKGDGFRHVGGRTVIMAAGVLMARRGFRLTGSGVSGVGPLIIRSPIGAAPTGVGVIHSRPCKKPRLSPLLGSCGRSVIRVEQRGCRPHRGCRLE